MDTPPLTEDEMSEIKKEVLIRLRPYLCDKIIADRHFDYLRARRILTRDDTEEIYCRSTQRKKTGMLLDFLAENPRGLDTLIESIQLCRSLNHIITKITDEVQKVKNERLEALRASASSSSSGYLPMKGASNDLSRTLSYESNLPSTMLFHPESEGCASTSDATGSLKLPSASSRADAPSMGGGSVTVSLSTASSSLPRPGDPGAPPLPEELLAESSASMDAGAQSTSSAGDANFQPLRSRSLTPHRDISPCQSYHSQ
ncbi:B-cell lymphoma/leukemia 10 [Hypomesus transpacificus]|uniref:B-cell lymphoma/leukemia 10 n=1 Tax=Hypomesus transpacificus TaxID=137520 RepID=UPI001F07A118|nr:B-cell lymphoma/leukemia 10 [Hypomesus transpacificus]